MGCRDIKCPACGSCWDIYYIWSEIWSHKCKKKRCRIWWNEDQEVFWLPPSKADNRPEAV